MDNRQGGTLPCRTHTSNPEVYIPHAHADFVAQLSGSGGTLLATIILRGQVQGSVPARNHG